MSNPFDAYAEGYNSWYEENRDLYREELEGVMELGLAGFGLEVGVGTGVFAAPVGVKLGLDPSLPMLRKARNRGIDVVRGVAESLPFRDGLFDFVLMTTTLCFLDDPSASLSEIRRVLRADGILGVCVIPRDSAWGALYARKAREDHPVYSAANFYTVQEVRDMLQESGYIVEKVVQKLTRPPEELTSVLEGNGAGFVCLRARKAHSTRGGRSTSSI